VTTWYSSWPRALRITATPYASPPNPTIAVVQATGVVEVQGALKTAEMRREDPKWTTTGVPNAASPRPDADMVDSAINVITTN
jgi:hypothetical protein